MAKLKSKTKKKILTALFYGTLGVISSLAMFLVFYWSLSLNSSIYSLINNTKSEPVYLILYIVLTLGAIVLFGINVPLLVYRWRKYGAPKFTSQSGTWFGSFVGIAASACPVCGSLILSAVGITGGLAAFPFGGLELKALSFGLLALPVFLTTRQIKRFESGVEACPIPKDAFFGKKDGIWLVVLAVLLAGLFYWSIKILSSDPFFLNSETSEYYQSCRPPSPVGGRPKSCLGGESCSGV